MILIGLFPAFDGEALGFRVSLEYRIFKRRSWIRCHARGRYEVLDTSRCLADGSGVTERILNIKCAVEKEIGGIARHMTSTAVIETFDGSLLWEGVVETFEIACNPMVERCYGFAYREDDTLRYVAIAETDQVNSPKMAVKTFIASRRSDGHPELSDLGL